MKKLNVVLTEGPDDQRLIGQLAEKDRRVYFEYDPHFLRAPLWLSPFKLPPGPGLIEHRDRGFGPLFGLFDDSLPDGWGLLLMDKYFSQHGITPATVSPLDRLAYLGTHTMGALTYHPPAQDDSHDSPLVDLHNLAGEAYQLLEGKSETVLPQLLKVGGSPGGARPKVLIGLRGEEMIAGHRELPAGYTGWIVKFLARADAVDDGRVEYAYSQMAEAAGIVMPPTTLFMTAREEAFFGVKRFDRDGNRRRHVHTFGGLIHSNYRIPACDYEMLLKVTAVLTRNQADVSAAFRMMVFNILAHNRDDHVKNFSFVLGPEGEWRLSPAYDLTFSHGPGGEHSMTVAGEGRRPAREHVKRLAESASLAPKMVSRIIEDVSAAVACWPEFAQTAQVSRQTTKTIQLALQACQAQFG